MVAIRSRCAIFPIKQYLRSRQQFFQGSYNAKVFGRPRACIPPVRGVSFNVSNCLVLLVVIIGVLMLTEEAKIEVLYARELYEKSPDSVQFARNPRA
jgi:hypothetical protein